MNNIGDILYCSALVFLYVAIVSANSIVIFVYMQMKNLRKTITNFLLFNQALIDLFNGIILSGLTIVTFFSAQYVTNKTLDFWMAFTNALVFNYSIALNLGSLIIISSERYCSIAKPLFHRKVIDKHAIKKAVVFIWCISILSTPGELLHCFSRLEVYYKAFFILMFSLVLFGMVSVSGILIASFIIAKYELTKDIRKTSNSSQVTLYIENKEK